MHRKKLDLQRMLLCKTVTAETAIIQLLSIDRNVFLCTMTPTLCWLLHLEVIAAAWKTVLGCLLTTRWKMDLHSLNAAPPAKCTDSSLQLYWLKSIRSNFINSSVLGLLLSLLQMTRMCDQVLLSSLSYWGEWVNLSLLAKTFTRHL